MIQTELKQVDVALTAVVCEGRLLLLQRKQKPGDPIVMKWCMPGGKIEVNENVQDAACRELSEEVGIVLLHFDQSAFKADVFQKDHTYALNGVTYRFRISLLKCDTYPAIKLEDKFCGYGWFSMKEVLSGVDTTIVTVYTVQQIEKMAG